MKSLLGRHALLSLLILTVSFSTHLSRADAPAGEANKSDASKANVLQADAQQATAPAKVAPQGDEPRVAGTTGAKANDPPPIPQRKDAFSDQPILRNPAAGKSDPAKDPALDGSSRVGFDATRVLLALGGVIALIFLLRTVARRMLPGAAVHRSTTALKVVSRFTVGPKQHLLLVQVGKRLLVVGDGGAQLNPLCEITEASEVEHVLSQVRDESISAANRFDSLFGLARKGFGFSGKGTADDEAHAATSSVPDHESSDATETPELPFDPSHEIHDPSFDATRQELSGLSQKVKDIARQLGTALPPPEVPEIQ